MILVECLLFLVVGAGLNARVGRARIASRFESALCASLTAGALWFSTTWVLALTGSFTRPALLARLLLLAVAAVAITWRGRRRISAAFATNYTKQDVLLWGTVAVPLILWLVFLLWRAAVIPPVSHDALSYHLPKALFIARDAGYHYMPNLHGSVRTTPVNYELLLAEEILLSGTDRLVEWALLPFYALLLLGAATLAARLRNAGPFAITIVVLATAGIPVALLHSGTIKNDLMVCSLIVAALAMSGRWWAAPDLHAFTMMCVAFGIAVGTKPQAAAIAICVIPFVVWRAVCELRKRGPGFGLLLLGVAVFAFFALGGAVYAINIANESSLLNARDGSGGSVEVVPYGDWRNLWQGPYVLLAAPFSWNDQALSVPWSQRPWFWRRYEVYFSSLGSVFAIAVLMIPLLALTPRGDSSLRERIAVAVPALSAFVLMLPVGFKPHGLYAISLPRYALFLAPLLFAIVLPPLVSLLERRHRGLAAALVGALLIVFVANVIEYGSEDAFAPIDYVMWASTHKGTRSVPFDPHRAASVADRAAGPADRIAIDAGFGAWIYPAFGARLTRAVELIPEGSGAVVIGPDVKWVVVDRAYQIVWGHPQFNDLSEAPTYLLRGKPRELDLRVFNAMAADRHFQLVFYNQKLLQAVFRRVEHAR